ncbi:MAG: 16S rRNA (cytosine(1402)-N(4))-methyltransferase RsmH [Planctomycetota bacterium]
MSEAGEPREVPPHAPVMEREVVEFFAPLRAGVILDLTVGAGGHAAALLEHLPPQVSVWGLDRDPTAVKLAARRLRAFGERARVAHGRFDQVLAVFPELVREPMAGALMDLGVSSMQLDSPQRGFSFDRDGPLDMRMDGAAELTAEIIVNRWSQAELQRIFAAYGEEPRSAAVARAIVESRRRAPIRTTGALAHLVARVAARSRSHHPATCVFQALRIAVNDELETLRRGLDLLIERLAPGGRLAVIAFHSLEDRIVKEHLRAAAAARTLVLAIKKPLQASAAEVRRNRRSRSAKLRLAIRC